VLKFGVLKLLAQSAVNESEALDFKEHFNPTSKGEWLEILKDLVAFANSGGGCIVFGIQDGGQPSGLDCMEVCECDPADLTNKFYSFTGRHFSDFEIAKIERGGLFFAAILVQSVDIPLVFSAVGNYQTPHGKQKTAFVAGSVYFRHGAKSEPCTSEDLSRFVDREICRVREQWLGRLRMVVEAPPNSDFQVVSSSSAVRLDQESGMAVRITQDPTAPAYRIADPDLTHPHRQKDVVIRVNQSIGGTISITTHDFLCARRIYGLDSKPEYSYKPQHGSQIYTETAVMWMVEQILADPKFLSDCREGYRLIAPSRKRRR
jgi:hypothetical protein